MMNVILLLVLVLGFAHGDLITTSGYVVDNFCWKDLNGVALDTGADLTTSPFRHTLKCLRQVPVCRQSGFVIVDLPPGKTKYEVQYELSSSGNAKLLELMDAAPSSRLFEEKGFQVTATGKLNDGGLLDIVNIVEGIQASPQVEPVDESPGTQQEGEPDIGSPGAQEPPHDYKPSEVFEDILADTDYYDENENNTFPSDGNNTISTNENTTIPTIENNTISTNENTTIPTIENNTISTNENNTIPIDENNTIAVENGTQFGETFNPEFPVNVPPPYINGDPLGPPDLEEEDNNNDIVSATGYLVDYFCWRDLNGIALDSGANLKISPQLHSIHCMVDIPVCRDSGFAMVHLPRGAAEYQVQYQLDDQGNEIMIKLMDGYDDDRKYSQDGFLVTLKGTVKPGTNILQVTEAAEATSSGKLLQILEHRLTKHQIKHHH